jgi:hypothetical protein
MPVDPLPAIGAPTLFPFPPDGEADVTLEETLATDIEPAEGGEEIRVATRSKGVRTLSFTALFGNAGELLLFRDRWQNATQALRYLVPIWPEGSRVTAIAGAVLTVDTTDRDFVEGAQTALLYQADALGPGLDLYELVDVDVLADGSVTLADDPIQPFVPGEVDLIPVMVAWVDPPNVDELAIDAERLPLTFREELPAIAGIEPTITADDQEAAVVVTAIEIYKIQGQEVGVPGFWLFRAVARDAAGVALPGVAIDWTTDPTEDDDPNHTLAVSPDTHFARFDWFDDPPFTVFVTASVGAVSATYGIGR